MTAPLPPELKFPLTPPVRFSAVPVPMSAVVELLMTAIENGAAASRASTDSMRAILSRQEFNDEIPAGLPPGTRVAHKTGQITGHLHDAAIVYPQRRGPYVLVVLTRGIDDEKVARSLIADISRMVYDHATAAGSAAAARDAR